MLYQLSYASAAQTEQNYQKGTQIASNLIQPARGVPVPRKTASGRAYFTPSARTSILASLSSPTPSRRKSVIVAAILLLILAGAAYYIFFRGPAKPAGPAPGPIPSIIELLPAEAPIFAYFDITALRNSQLSAELSSLAGKPASDPDYAEFVRQTGFDYERDLDRAALAIWPGASRPAALAIAEGRFDREKSLSTLCVPGTSPKIKISIFLKSP